MISNINNLFYLVFIVGFSALVVIMLVRLWEADLKGLISEPEVGNNKASLSRFQFLIFTFVIAGLYFVLCIESGTFVEIPNSALTLMGISGGSFLVSKGISSANQQKAGGGETPPKKDPNLDKKP